MLGHVPDHDRVEGRPLGGERVELLDPDVEAEHLAGLAGGGFGTLGPDRLPASAPHLVEEPSRPTSDVEHAPPAADEALDPFDPAAMDRRQGAVETQAVPLGGALW